MPPPTTAETHAIDWLTELAIIGAVSAWWYGIVDIE